MKTRWFRVEIYAGRALAWFTVLEAPDAGEAAVAALAVVEAGGGLTQRVCVPGKPSVEVEPLADPVDLFLRSLGTIGDVVAGRE